MSKDHFVKQNILDLGLTPEQAYDLQEANDKIDASPEDRYQQMLTFVQNL